MEKHKSLVRQLKIVAISRGNEFSPNHISNDEQIFCEVVNNLKKFGIRTRVVTEKEFVDERIECDLVYGMVREKSCLERLKLLEESGVTVINSAFGIENCCRGKMTKLLLENKIPHPQSSFFNIDDEHIQKDFPCWLKRGDSHAMVKQDVVYVRNQQEYEKVIEDFKSRGINSVVTNEHLQGDLIKFYGVKDTDFFYWFYPSPCSHSKFGLEKINGVAKKFKFSLSNLKKYSDMASEALNVPIYGGDCVVSKNGTIRIIDFNDWPSFARCREEAGKNIAEYIYNNIIKLRSL